ncbi:MAG: hypothetical protein V3T86_14255 [Planctomycetota bacterium]
MAGTWLHRFVIYAAALSLLGFAGCLFHFFGNSAPDPASAAWEEHIVLFVTTLLGASLLHIGAWICSYRKPPRLELVLAVALVARLIVMFAPESEVPIVDAARIRIEARQVRVGLNPYEFSVSELSQNAEPPQGMDSEKGERFILARGILTESRGPRAVEVARPDVRSDRAPASHWAAAAAEFYRQNPRLGRVFMALIADALAIFFLVLALVELKKPTGLIMLYAWSPVLLHETYAVVSPDIFVLPGIAFLIWAIAKGWRIAMAIPIAVAASFRPILAILAIPFARRLGFRGFLLFAFLVVLPLTPFLAIPIPVENYFEGSVSRYWHGTGPSLFEGMMRLGADSLIGAQTSNGLFLAGVQLIRAGGSLAPLLAKAAGVCVLLGMVIAAWSHQKIHTYRWAGGRRDRRYAALLMAIAAILYISPSLTPGMTLWLLPVLMFRPALSWLTLPGFFGLTYLGRYTAPVGSDLVLPEGPVPMAVIIGGCFLALWVLDLNWRDRLFPVDAWTEEKSLWGIDAGEFAVVAPDAQRMVAAEPKEEFAPDPFYERTPSGDDESF